MGTRFRVWVCPLRPILTSIRVADLAKANWLQAELAGRIWSLCSVGNVRERPDLTTHPNCPCYSFTVLHNGSFSYLELLDVLDGISEIEAKLVENSYKPE